MRTTITSRIRHILAIIFILSLSGAPSMPSGTLLAETRDKGENTRDALSEKLIADYLRISSALAADSTKGVDAAAKRILTATESYLKNNPPNKEADELIESAKIISAHAKLLGSGKNDIMTARQFFAVISDELSWILSGQYKGSNRNKYHIFYCSMVGHYWFQKDPKIRNPYFGKSMSGCGSEVKEVVRETAANESEEEHDPFAVVDAPPSPRAEAIMKKLKCACCGKPLIPATCGCAMNTGKQVKNDITEMEDGGLKDAEIITRLRAKFGNRVVPEELSKEESK